jgi:hypothetical protein
MASLSIGKAWEDSVAFVRREWELLSLVALLFMTIPSIILQQMVPPELVQWASQRKGDLPPLPADFVLGMGICLLVTAFGSLALFALALRPGVSAGEALRLGVARLPAFLGSMLVMTGIFAAAILILVVPIAVLAMVSRIAGGLAVTFGTAMLFGFIGYASIRLLLLNPVVLDRPEGPLGLLRRAWRLSQGHFLRLFAFFIVFSLVTLVVSEAARIVLGSIGGLVGGAGASVAIGNIASTIATTAVQVYGIAMLSRIYRQLDPGR